MIRACETNKHNSDLEQAQPVASEKTNQRREDMTENGKSRYSYQATFATAQKVNWRDRRHHRRRQAARFLETVYAGIAGARGAVGLSAR